MVKKAVIYCRVSTKEQVDEGNSLVSQERLCREYAKNEGYEVTEVYIEKGESAKTANRTQLNLMLKSCTSKKGAIQAVISYKVDRISRSVADYSIIKGTLKRYGVEIRSVTEFFEDTPAGRFMENIIANVGQFDNEVRTERSMGGMKEAVIAEGRYVWKPPTGFDNVRVDGKATIAKNKMAPLILEVFERIVSPRSYSTDEIRLLMAEKGLVNINGDPISRGYFFRLIRNPLYMGVIKMFGGTYKGTFEPIVSVELFTLAQAILSGRKNIVKQYKRENEDFPLRRFVTDEGGDQLTGYWAKGKYKKYAYYTFKKPGTILPKAVLEQKFVRFLSQFEFDATLLKRLQKHLESAFENKGKSTISGREDIERNIKNLNDQIDNLILLQSKGSISATLMSERIARLEDEIYSLKSFLINKTEKDYNISELMKFATIFLKSPQNIWLNANFQIRKRIQKFDFPEGVVFDGENFRTPKLCRLFKLKTILEREKFPRVNLRDTGKNTLGRQNKPAIEEMLSERKAYWVQIGNELKDLNDFLNLNAS